jgi:hypothetical protein
VHITALIAELLAACIAKYATYRWKNMYSKINNVADCKISKKRSLAVEYLVLILYNYPTAKTRTLYESTDGPATNPPSSDGFEDLHSTVPELTVRVYWHPGSPIEQWFGFDRDPDPK